MSAADFERLPENGKRRELVRGEVIETMLPGAQHGAVVVNLALLLRLWTGRGAYVGVKSGFCLSRNPDTVRAPDVAYVKAERLPASGIPKGFWQLAPDLAAIVVSPSETAEEVRAKVRDFLEAGTPLVWVIYPHTKEVVAHTPDGFARTFAQGMRLEHPDTLPGFTCTVTELFDS